MRNTSRVVGVNTFFAKKYNAVQVVCDIQPDTQVNYSIYVNCRVFLFTQAQLDEYIRRLEEAERNIKAAEAKIAERDQRIMELERLLDCMSKVRPT